MSAQSARRRGALVTGGGSGIGRRLALDLALKSTLRCAVTVADIDSEGALRVAEEIERAGGAAVAVHCDVADSAQHELAFQIHMHRWGRLDIAVLNAGIGERSDLVWGEPAGAWQATLDINLRAVAEGVRLAVRAMTGGQPDRKCGGAILVTASAGGIFPMPVSPVYSASKAGCVQLVRSLGPPLQKRHGISITALCPQFTDTGLVRWMRQQGGGRTAQEAMKETQGQLLTPEQVAEAGLALLGDPSKAGSALVVLVNGSWMQVAPPRLHRVTQPGRGGNSAVNPDLAVWAAGGIPTTARQVEVVKLSTDFRAATRIESRPLPSPLPPGTVLVRRLWTAINASDTNFSAGRYFGSTAAAEEKLPFAAGFESIGIVAALAVGVSGVAVGQPVASMTYGGFAEASVVPAQHLLPAPRASPEVLALLTSGLTASIALEQCGRVREGERVLITAAAGGAGHLAVQLARLAGCHVVATCGGSSKAAFLRRLGADRVINYREESVKEVLKREYMAGVDVVFESVGGEMFDTAVNALAIKGRLIVIGAMSQYESGWQRSVVTGLPEKLLWKSATVCGFFLNHYTALWKRHLARLTEIWEAGKLQVSLDSHSSSFVGLEAVPDAVEWLQSGRSWGKVVVQVAPALPPSPALAAPAVNSPRPRL